MAAQTALAGHLATFKNAINKKNGNSFAKLIALPVGKPITQPIRTLVDKIQNLNVIQYCEQNLSETNTAAIIAYRLMALISIVNSDYENAYKHALVAYTAALEIFSEKDDLAVWIVPVLTRVSNDIRTIAEKVNLEIIRSKLKLLSILIYAFLIIYLKRLMKMLEM